MARIYAVTFDEVAVTAQQDLFDIAPATNKPIKIHELIITQSSEVAEAQEEVLHIRIVRGFATVGSGGSAFTAVPYTSSADVASGATCRINDTSKAVVGAGATDVLRSDNFQVRAGYYWLPTPETQPIISAASTRVVVQLNTTPADSVTLSGTLLFEEIA
jgi:hypothetical protein